MKIKSESKRRNRYLSGKSWNKLITKKETLLIDLRDGKTVEVNKGEILIIPKGVEHRPHTNGEVVFTLLFEPKTTQHTGDIETEMTVKKLEWI